MATDTVIHEHDEVDDHGVLEEDWSGGVQPFRVSYGKLMMWYFLLSDAFTFAGFLIAYGTTRFMMPTWPVPDFVFQTAPFGITNAPLIFVTIMSFLLILSSVTMVRAVQEGHRENKRGVMFWMFLTILGGAGFLGCQAWEWTNLIGTEGMTVTTDPFSAHLESGTYMSEAELTQAGFEKQVVNNHGAEATYFLPAGAPDLEENRYFVKADHHGHVMAGESFNVSDPYLITYNHNTHLYEKGAFRTTEGEIMREEFGPVAFGSLFFFITGFHGFHVLSGVVFLIIILMNVASGLYEKRRNGYEMVEKIGLYWHFVDLVWVFVFLVFYLL